MTSLLICYPDIPYNAKTVTPSATTSTDQNEWNLVSGERFRSFAFSATSTSRSIVYDLGASYSSGQATVNYLVLARADKLISAGVTQIDLDSSPDNSAWTNRLTNASFASATLYGPRSDDYIQTISVTSAIRYWRITYTSGAATTFPHSKLYFGTYFDWGKEPSTYSFERIASGDSTFIASSGSQINERIDEPYYQFTLNWSGVTDAKVKSFQAVMGDIYYKENGVFLYTATEHQVLDSQRLVHCRIVDAESRKVGGVANRNDVRIVFEEMIG